MDKEKIENLEKENERLRDDFNLSEKFHPESGTEESKIGKKKAQKLYNQSMLLNTGCF